MRKITFALLAVILTATVALAEWLVNFQDTYFKEGIDNAVVVAMQEGVTPDLIVENGLNFEGLNHANLIKALYCAGAQGEDIRAAAEKYGISEILVAAGFEKSLAECADQVADAQPFTPVATGTSFTSVTPGGGGDSVSPDTF